MFAGTAFHSRTAAAKPESKTQIDSKKRLEQNKKRFCEIHMGEARVDQFLNN